MKKITVCFWLSFVGVIANVGLALFGPVPEMAAQCYMNAGVFGLAAFMFWVQENTQ